MGLWKMEAIVNIFNIILCYNVLITEKLIVQNLNLVHQHFQINYPLNNLQEKTIKVVIWITEVCIATGQSFSSTIKKKNSRILKSCLWGSIFKSSTNQDLNEFIINGKNGGKHAWRINLQFIAAVIFLILKKDLSRDQIKMKMYNYKKDYLWLPSKFQCWKCIL